MMTLIRVASSITATVAVALVLAPNAWAQRDFSTVEIRAHHVSGSVYYLEGAAGNNDLTSGEDGVVMIII